MTRTPLSNLTQMQYAFFGRVLILSIKPPYGQSATIEALYMPSKTYDDDGEPEYNRKRLPYVEDNDLIISNPIVDHMIAITVTHRGITTGFAAYQVDSVDKTLTAMHDELGTCVDMLARSGEGH